ncbi:uncharacterized protein METZ01_LOCUS449612, partial [marine metagenome]
TRMSERSTSSAQTRARCIPGNGPETVRSISGVRKPRSNVRGFSLLSLTPARSVS